MEFSINQQIFIKALNDVNKAISNRPTLPILTNVKLVVTENKLILIGSDTDISIETSISIKNKEANLQINSTGGITVPATFFTNIVKCMPNENINITNIDNFQIKISSGSTEYKIHGQDINNYPHLPEVNIKNKLILSSKTLIEIIKQTIIAISKQLNQPILTGVHFILGEGNLTAIATDRHRLAQRTIPFKNKEINADIIVPGLSLLKLQGMLEAVENVELQVSTNQVIFQLGPNTLFYSRLLEGNYPDTSRLIPTEKKTTLTINSNELLQTINRAALISHEGRSNVIQFNISDKHLIISSKSPEIGKIEEKIFKAKTTGDNLNISFNPDYMKDALKSFNNEEIQIGFKTALDPFTLVPTNNEINFIQLITPVRTY